MMKKILGSILIVFTLQAFATVTTLVDKTQFYPGDTVHLTISAAGEDINFPNINAIGGNAIIGNSSSQSISMINGKTTKKISKSYSFKPKTSLTIPSFALTIDGITQQSDTIDIIKLQPRQNSDGDDFILELKPAKYEFFAGEYLDIQVILKKKKSASFAGDINVEPLQAEGLEFFTDSRFSPEETADYIVYTANYRIRANTIGNITIEPAVAILSDKVLGFGGFFNTSKQRIYSNALTLSVLPLPNNLTIYGTFDITSNAHTTTATAGEAINVDVRITGEGNINDIEKFVLDIPGATIYSDEPTIENNTIVQKFAIIAEKDFQIPSFELEYFDKTTEQPQRIRTDAIDITIHNIHNNQITPSKNTAPIIDSRATSTQTITTPQIVHTQGMNYLYIVISFILGILITLAITFFKQRVRTQELPIITQIKRAKNDKELFHILLPLDSEVLQEVLQQLESNLYASGNYKINKKEIIAIVKEL